MKRNVKFFRDRTYSKTIRNDCRPINDFFKLIYLLYFKLAKSINLNCYCRTKAANKIVNNLY